MHLSEIFSEKLHLYAFSCNLSFDHVLFEVCKKRFPIFIKSAHLFISLAFLCVIDVKKNFIY